jgi:formylglycine-generating enzyme required for sulfatase activity
MNTKMLLVSCLACCWLSMSSTSTQLPNLREAQDYALFFAVNTYEYMDDLQNPIQNAEDIATELGDNFGFQTDIVENPTLDDIDAKLAEYERNFNNGTFSQKGQLFVFFSGHGVSVGDNGYFMTQNADPDRPHRTALDYNFYRNKIDQLACQHILIVVDACHSATFDPLFASRSNRNYTRPGEKDFDRVLANHERYRTRGFWTSDGQGDETPDKSTFARQLLEALRNHQSPTNYLRSKEVYAIYLETASPRPGGGSFGQDEAGACFLFFKNAQVNLGDARADRAAYQAARTTNTLADYRQYLRNYPNGDFRLSVEEALAVLEYEERELLAWQKTKAANTTEAYSTFVETYPNSLYTSEAAHRKSALLELAQQNKEAELKPIAGRRVYDPNTGTYVLADPPTTSTAPDNFIRVEGGTYTMGCQDGRDTDCSDSEKPPHQVTVSTFYLSKYEVTQAQWRQVMGRDPTTPYNKGCDQCPVEKVSWNDIQEFLQKLNAQTGQNYRLPTEAEWEYAARGGNKSRGYLYSGSNDIGEVAWYSANAQEGNSHGAQRTTRPVGGKKPNELGLYDMSGNVWEWCSDWYGYYENSAQQNPRSPTSGTARVLRGGSWLNNPRDCRSANRGRYAPAFSHNNIGFRLARS